MQLFIFSYQIHNSFSAPNLLSIHLELELRLSRSMNLTKQEKLQKLEVYKMCRIIWKQIRTLFCEPVL